MVDKHVPTRVLTGGRYAEVWHGQSDSTAG
jgi:hypothetical protein